LFTSRAGFSIIIVINLDNVKINHYDIFMARSSYHHGNLKEELVESGIKILREEGINALSLRNVARKAGVSHSAPYAHFLDKQALLAAISTRGFHILFQQIDEVSKKYATNPETLVVEIGWVYCTFAFVEPALFKLMFSGILEDEHSYPEFMTAARAPYHKLVEVVERCQAAGVLPAGLADRGAVAIWSLVHGFISLYQERQLPGQVLQSARLKELLASILDQLTR